MYAAELFKSLSEPIRLRLLHLLTNTEPELCVCDLVAVIAAPQGTISRHLTQLRHLGLVAVRREGVWVYYRLADSSSTTHDAILQCMKTSFADEPQLADDLKKYKALKKSKSLACCAPQSRQGRQALLSRKPKLKVKG